MAVFSDNITNSLHDAHSLASMSLQEEKWGRIDGSFDWIPKSFDLSKISKEDIDSVIDNILSYIYYYVVLGLNELKIKKHQIEISVKVFGIDRFNYKTKLSISMMGYVIEQFEKKGFEVTFLVNDMELLISWNNVYAKLI